MATIVIDKADGVADLLRSWDLGGLIPDFEKNHITEKVFFKLNDATIDRLIPSIGFNILFEEQFEELKLAKNVAIGNHNASPKVVDDTENQNPNEDEDLVHFVEYENLNEHTGTANNLVHEVEVIHPDSVNGSARPIQDITNLPNSSANNLQQPAVSETCDTQDVPDLDSLLPTQCETVSDMEYEEFIKILESNVYGHLLIANFNRTGRIDKRYLNKALLPTLMVRNKNYRLVKKDWNFIIASLKRFAPNEKPTTFYTSKTNSSQNTGGCCYYFYRTICEDMKKEGLIRDNDSVPPKRTKTDCSSQVSVLSEQAQSQKDMETLRNDYGDLDKMKPIWLRTFKDRSLLDHNIDIEAKVKRFKCLEQSYAHELFSSDFDMMYKDQAEAFTKDWPIVASLIVKIVGEDSRSNVATEFYKDNQILIDEGKVSLLGLLLLPLVADTRTIKAKWRPTKNEVKDAFILHVQTLADLKTKQEAQTKYYNSHGCKSIQPYVVIVGALTAIDSCYIQVNDHQYVVDDPIKAVNSCYKIFFALNAEYPPDAKHVWMFLQKYIFKMKLDEKELAPVENLCRSLDVKKKGIQNRAGQSRQK